MKKRHKEYRGALSKSSQLFKFFSDEIVNWIVWGNRAIKVNKGKKPKYISEQRFDCKGYVRVAAFEFDPIVIFHVVEIGSKTTA